MKKLGFIALALITVLTTLGVGFAMWSQTVTITGQVNTGNVSVSVSDPSSLWVYKILSTGAIDYETVALPANTADHLLVGYSAFASVFPQTCTNNNGISLTAQYSNLFPIFTDLSNTTVKDWTVDFNLTNAGSIPIKATILTAGVLSPTSAPNGDLPSFHFTVAKANGEVVSLEGYQLEPGDVIHVVIGIDVGEQTAQSYTGSFTVQIKWEQWNEYAPPTTT